MKEFYRQLETPLDRAVDRAISEYNAAYLADPEAQRRARETGELWARVFEAKKLGFVEVGYPHETLEQFCQRAGV